MPLPSGIATVTVTAGPYVAVDGTAARGEVRLTPAAPIRHASSGAVVLAGTVIAPLVAGSASVTVPASDEGGGVTYRVEYAFAYGSSPAPSAPFDVFLPAAVPTVNLDDLAPVPASTSRCVGAGAHPRRRAVRSGREGHLRHGRAAAPER